MIAFDKQAMVGVLQLDQVFDQRVCGLGPSIHIIPEKDQVVIDSQRDPDKQLLQCRQAPVNIPNDNFS